MRGLDLGVYYVSFYAGNTPVCPSIFKSFSATFDRTTQSAGTTYPFPTTGMSLSLTAGGQSCSSWTGSMKIDSDLPDWSVTINATCSTGALSGQQVIGTLSGSE